MQGKTFEEREIKINCCIKWMGKKERKRLWNRSKKFAHNNNNKTKIANKKFAN